MRDHLFEVDTMPPFLDTMRIMQRADEVGAIQRILTDPQTSTVMLVGDAGTGKSTLAALLYQRLLMAKEAGMPAPHHLVWLRMGAYTTFPDMLAALLNALHALEPDFASLKSQQQISTLLRALRRTQENALIVLDQFEELLHNDAMRAYGGSSERELASLFFEMLQTNLGNSRMLLTSREMLLNEQDIEERKVRSYRVSRISMPEGTMLLQRYGINGSPEELSMVWQRCSGHVFTLVIFCALVHISGISPTTLLSNEYQGLWHGDVMQQLVSLLYQRLNLIQRHILRGLSLFDEPVPANAIIATMSNGNEPFNKLYGNGQFMSRFERELQIVTQLSILQVVARAEQEKRFVLHPVVRQYILDHYLEMETYRPDGKDVASIGVSGPLNPLRTNPEAQQIALAAGHRQVASYYYTLMKEHYPLREQRTSIQDVIPLIAAIRHLCLGYQWQTACDLLFAEGLHQSLPRWGAWRTLANLYIALLPPLGTVKRRDEGLIASLLGTLYGQLGDYQQSQSYFDHALLVQREIHDVRGEAVTLANRGELCRMREEFMQAQAYFEQAISLSRQQGSSERQDIHLRSVVLHNMGLLYHRKKDYTAAFNCYIHALRLTYKLQEQYDKGTILTNLGFLLYEQGKQREALSVLLAALSLRQTLQDSGTTLLARFLFGVEQSMGTETYEQLCQQALATQEEVFSQLMTTKETA